MQATLDWLQRTWNFVVVYFSELTLGSALWLGFLLLTLILLILMSTRWGQVKPIWKCAVLSIFAHVLLGGYAYGTKLIFTTPQKPTSQTVALKIVDSDEPNRLAEDDGTTQVNPWDKLDLAPESLPVTNPVNRLQPRVQQTITRTQPEISPPRPQPQIPAEVRGQLTLEEPPSLALDTQTPPEIRTSDETVVSQAQPIEVNRQKREETSPFQVPNQFQSDSVARIDTANDETLIKSGSRSAPEPMVNQNQDQTGLLRNLAKSANSNGNELSDALAQQSEGLVNQTDSQWGRPDQDSETPYQFASAPRRLADGLPMPDIYAGRSPEKRKEKASRNGGSIETEKAVDDALRFLAGIQEPDGRWSSVNNGGGQERLVLGHDRQGAGTAADTGVTGLTILAYLAAGHSHLEGEHRQTVQKGLEYLLTQQATDGNMAGSSKLFARMYCHAMATLAITETLAMTGDVRLRDPVQRAVNYSLQSQHPTLGGWRYRPGDDGDMSQFGWQVLVVKSAELAGMTIPPQSKQLMKQFLDQCTSGSAKGLASYRPGQPPSITMTAEALVCRNFLEDVVHPATSSEAAQYLLQDIPGTSEENLYYWYYGTLAMFQTGGEAWENWNHHLTKTLLGSQNQNGEHAGSWDPNGLWAGYGGRVYSTAMAALCLEVYYRYQAPTSEKP